MSGIIATVLTFLVGMLIGAFTIVLQNVQSAPIDSAPPCDPIGATGNIVISRCVDEETGQVLYVNNIGMMILGE